MEQKRDLLKTVVSSCIKHKEVYKNVAIGISAGALLPVVGFFTGAGIGIAVYQGIKNRDKIKQYRK